MTNVERQLASGALSGFAASVSLQPFDLLKTRLQQLDGSLKPGNTTLILRTAQNIFATNGPSGLWRGTSATLIRNVPGVALYMTSLTQIRALLAHNGYFTTAPPTKSSSVLPTLSSQGNLLAGATARVGVGFLLNPFTVLKARFESNIYAYETLSGAFVSIVRLGPSELLRGFAASSLRDAPYAGLFVVFYEGLKQKLSRMPTVTQDYAAAVNSVSAASAGALATVLTHPFDVIKTKIQVRSEDRYRGFGRTVGTIWAQRGMMGFFDGVSLRMTRKVLSSAIAWVVFESVLKYLNLPPPK